MAMIDPLYNFRLANERTLCDERLNEALDALFQTFTAEQRKLWKAYECCNNATQQQETQRFYTQGVKDGISLILEALQ